jgi:hypothetical protein
MGSGPGGGGMSGGGMSSGEIAAIQSAIGTLTGRVDQLEKRVGLA